ncbi:hypothetical protein B0H13DRAFT_1908733 [Mycena leptocephala]|nr:hypothetical protein B0H13DRAFT_1908733 [Mycena leptocephala]
MARQWQISIEPQRLQLNARSTLCSRVDLSGATIEEVDSRALVPGRIPENHRKSPKITDFDKVSRITFGPAGSCHLPAVSKSTYLVSGTWKRRKKSPGSAAGSRHRTISAIATGSSGSGGNQNTSVHFSFRSLSCGTAVAERIFDPGVKCTLSESAAEHQCAPGNSVLPSYGAVGTFSISDERKGREVPISGPDSSDSHGRRELGLKAIGSYFQVVG